MLFLSVSTYCQSVLVVSQYLLSVSTYCQSVLIVSQCLLSVSTCCQSVLIVSQYLLSVSTCCRSVLIVSQYLLLVSTWTQISYVSMVYMAHVTGWFGWRSCLDKVDFAFSLVKSKVEASLPFWIVSLYRLSIFDMCHVRKRKLKSICSIMHYKRLKQE
jgi:hypothetical protein